MKPYLLLLPITLMLAGCGSAPPSQQPASQQETADTVAAQPGRTALPAVDFDHLYRLGIVRNGNSVRVGMKWDEAMQVFAAPPGAYEKSDLPPSIQGSPDYEARSWQTKNEGFGTILYRGRIAAALYEADDVTQDRVNEILASHQNEFGQAHLYDKTGKDAPAFFSGQFVRYWFWQAGLTGFPGDQYLMICVTEVKPQKFSVTAAVGWIPVMDALGMSPDAASRDINKADRLISKQRSGKK